MAAQSFDLAWGARNFARRLKPELQNSQILAVGSFRWPTKTLVDRLVPAFPTLSETHIISRD